MDMFSTCDFDQKFLADYQQGKTQPTNPENRFDEEKASVESLTNKTIADSEVDRGKAQQSRASNTKLRHEA